MPKHIIFRCTTRGNAVDLVTTINEILDTEMRVKRMKRLLISLLGVLCLAYLATAQNVTIRAVDQPAASVFPLSLNRPARTLCILLSC